MCFFMLFKCIYAHPSVDWGQTKSCFGNPRSGVFCGTAGTVMGLLVFLAGFWSEEHKPDEHCNCKFTPQMMFSSFECHMVVVGTTNMNIICNVMLMPLIKTVETLQ